MKRVLFDVPLWHLMLHREHRGLARASPADPKNLLLEDELFEVLYTGDATPAQKEDVNAALASWAEPIHAACRSLPHFQRLADDCRGDAAAAAIAVETLMDELDLPERNDLPPRAGFDYHLAKPPEADALLKLVAEAPGPGTCSALPAGSAPGQHELDAQHAEALAELIRLRDADPEAVREGLRFFQQHTASHFGYEEELMVDVGYPVLATHRQRHAEFLGWFHALREQLERSGPTPQAVGAFVDAVEARLARHVPEDRRFVEFILGFAPSASARTGPAAPPDGRGPAGGAPRRQTPGRWSLR